MYEADEDFPDDPEEYFFFVGKGSTVRKEDRKTEKLSMKISDNNPDKDLGQALLEDGPLTAGALPSTNAVTEEGSKAVLEALHGEVQKTKPKPNKEKTTEETHELEPKEPWESLIRRNNFLCSGVSGMVG